MSSFSALYAAYKKCRLGKRYKYEKMAFEENLSSNIYELHHRLAIGTYRISGYTVFKVYEPKEREIKCLYFKDRVVQRSLCDNAIKPYFQNRLVYDNCACQKGKGTHFGLYRVCDFLRSHYNKYGANGWILKGDINKYFYSIDCEKLKAMLFPKIHDDRLKVLLEHIIDSGSENSVGIPLGNQTSQWFALLYLDPLDRLVKEKLRIKYYSRYMDDFVLIHESKEYLKACLAEIKELVESLGLTLNPKTQIFPVRNGVDYLGFHIYLTETGKIVRKLRQNSKKAMKRRLAAMKIQYTKGEIEYAEVKRRLNSWIGHAKHGHTYHLRTHILKDAVFHREAAIKEDL